MSQLVERSYLLDGGNPGVAASSKRAWGKSRPGRLLLTGLTLISLVLTPTGAVNAVPLCGFTLGFKTLRDQIPDVVGECLENERFNLANGNAEQRTTGGLLVWRKVDNWTAFTDGATTWINGPVGLATRPNAGPLFEWEAPPAAVPPAAPPPAAPPPVTRPQLDFVRGDILGVEDFSDPSGGFAGGSESSRFFSGYREGELLVRKIEPSSDYAVYGEFDLRLANAAFSVDARLVGATETRYVGVSCRSQPDFEATSYRLMVFPSIGAFTLARFDKGRREDLVELQESPAIKRGSESNRLEIACIRNFISVSVNGTELAAVQDGTYSSGTMAFVLGSEGNVSAEAMFDNAMITELLEPRS